MIEIIPTGSKTIPVKPISSKGEVNIDSNSAEILNKKINLETSRAEAAEEELQKSKQNLGYIVLDEYLLNPECGVITNPLDLSMLNSYLINKVSINTNIYYLTLSNDEILIYFCANRSATRNQITLTRASGQFQLKAIPVGYEDHNQLNNLDYLSSGHTGFAGIEFGTTEYWNSRRDYRPPLGMLVIYTDYSVAHDGTAVPGIKIGDGNAYLVDKAFVGQDLAEVLNAHLNDLAIHITQEEREFWNNKINLIEPEIGEDLLVFNRD